VLSERPKACPPLEGVHACPERSRRVVSVGDCPARIHKTSRAADLVIQRACPPAVWREARFAGGALEVEQGSVVRIVLGSVGRVHHAGVGEVLQDALTIVEIAAPDAVEVSPRAQPLPVVDVSVGHAAIGDGGKTTLIIVHQRLVLVQRPGDRSHVPRAIRQWVTVPILPILVAPSFPPAASHACDIICTYARQVEGNDESPITDDRKADAKGHRVPERFAARIRG
jgi:hypothetical protein